MCEVEGEPVTARPGARAPLLFLLLLFVYFTTTAGHLFSPDEEVMFRTAESLALGRGLAIAPIAEGFSTQKGRDGKEYGQYGIGQSLLAVPWVWAGYVSAKLAPRSFIAVFPQHVVLPSGRVVRVYRDAEGNVFRACDRLFFQHQHDETSLKAWLVRARVSTMGAVTTALAAMLLYLLASELYASRRVGVGVGLWYGLCTVAWPQGRTFFSEPTVVVGLVWALWRLYRADRGRPREFLLAGAGVAWMLLCRNDSVFLCAGLGVYAVLVVGGNRTYRTDGTNRTPARGASRGAAARLLWLAALPMLAVAVIVALNYRRFGSLVSTGYESQEGGFEFSTPLLYGLHGFLFSPGRSLFVYSPILLLSPWGLWLLWRRDRRLCIGLLACILLHLVAMAKWVNWGGGWDWGPRHIFQLTPMLTLPLGGLLVETQWKRLRAYSLVVLVLASLGMNALGLLVSPIDSHLRLFEDAYARTHDESYARNAIARSPFSLEHCTPVLHLEMLLEPADSRPVPREVGPWRVGITPAFSGYDYDLFFIKLLRAPVGWLKWIAAVPLLLAVGFGLALARRLLHPERSEPACPPTSPPAS